MSSPLENSAVDAAPAAVDAVPVAVDTAPPTVDTAPPTVDTAPPTVDADLPAVHATLPAFGSIPAASVIAECLRNHADSTPRGPIARMFGVSPLTVETRSWYSGALGERAVADRLAQLGDDWSVLHSVPVGSRGSDIDHIIVGPPGVFTVNTKFHDGARIWLGASRLLVNGQKTDHLRNARFEAKRAAKLLSAATGTEVTPLPLIVLVGAKEVTVKQRPTDVVVLRDRELLRWLRRRPTVLAESDHRQIIDAAFRPHTWSDPPCSANPDITRFDQLQREVRAARRVRLAWASIGMLVLIATAIWAAPAAFSVVVSVL